MEHCRSSTYVDREAVLLMLETHYGAWLDRVALDALTSAILPYLARTRLPFEEAVPRIAKHYQCYGDFVGRLLESHHTPEWDNVLAWIIEYASNHTMFPRDTEAVSAPDLDAYDEIQQKIQSYNFEGTFESWLTVAVVSRLRRYWRDQQTLSAGGTGIKSKAERMSLQHASKWQQEVKTYHLSLDRLLERGDLRTSVPDTHGEAIAVIAESFELRTLIARELNMLASVKNDPLLVSVWHAIVEQGLKLREVADAFGLTISQVYRRIEQARQHLRRSPQICQWRDALLL
jgi:DNA-directed RNA polymerase specialized sigma24 family protein